MLEVISRYLLLLKHKLLVIAIPMEGSNGAGRVNAKVDQQSRTVTNNPAAYLDL